jgi:hypothetical protein
MLFTAIEKRETGVGRWRTAHPPACRRRVCGSFYKRTLISGEVLTLFQRCRVVDTEILIVVGKVLNDGSVAWTNNVPGATMVNVAIRMVAVLVLAPFDGATR